MLAWLHQATASEKEHLEALLKLVTAQGIIKIFKGYTVNLWKLKLELSTCLKTTIKLLEC